MTYKFDELTVLIAEDNQPMLDILKSILTTFGVGHVVGANNGEKAFSLFQAEKPDIVIVDWMMEPTDGIELTKKIRTDPSSVNPFVPIVLMTGFSEKQAVLRARDIGITEFPVKPFKAKDLYRRLVHIIERPRQFVRCGMFFGPDRRRRKSEDYRGPHRREVDLGNPDALKQAGRSLEDIRGIVESRE